MSTPPQFLKIFGLYLTERNKLLKGSLTSLKITTNQRSRYTPLSSSSNSLSSVYWTALDKDICNSDLTRVS